MKFKKYQFNNQELEIINKLKAIKILDPSLEFEKNCKNQLLNSLPEKSANISRYTKKEVTGWPFIWKTALISMLVIFLSVGSSYAAQNSLPGEPFYQAKRIIEEINFYLAFNQTTRLKFKINSAQNRLTEANKLLEQKGKTDLIYQALLDYNKTIADINKIMDNNTSSIITELTELENNYQQIVNNSSEEIKKQLQIQQGSQNQDMQRQEQQQSQSKQQIENKSETNFGLDNFDGQNEIDSGQNIPQQQQNKADNSGEKGTDQILSDDSSKNGQFQINKP